MSGLVDWRLAERIAVAGVGGGPSAMSGSELAPSSARAQRAVLDYTGLEPAGELPRAEWVTRREWGALNLRSMRELLTPVEDRIAGSLPGRGRRPVAALAGRALAIELGTLIALASKRVLGQYELSLSGVTRPPRLVFVGQNIEAAAAELGGSPGDMLDWVALHETTHAVHFGAAPWLAGHLGGLATRLIGEMPASVSPAGVLGAARRLVTADPRETIAKLRENDPLTLLAPAASRATIAEVQATMAAVEGYAEHVMDAAAGYIGPAVPDLRVAMERRRDSRGPLARLLAWLLGFEMKLRQYREGKRFADRVVASAGIAGLNHAWTGPAALPGLEDLADPERWLRRTAAIPS